jgi:hypothetical protein
MSNPASRPRWDRCSQLRESHRGGSEGKKSPQPQRLDRADGSSQIKRYILGIFHG